MFGAIWDTVCFVFSYQLVDLLNDFLRDFCDKFWSKNWSYFDHSGPPHNTQETLATLKKYSNVAFDSEMTLILTISIENKTCSASLTAHCSGRKFK